MKNINKIFKGITAFLFASLMLAVVSCEDFLEENSISNQTTNTYYSTAQGFNDLTNSCYTLLRDITKERNLVLLGTDVFTKGTYSSVTGEGDPFNLYDIRLNSTLEELEDLWVQLYRNINRANTVISRQQEVVDIDEDLLNERVAEAKFIRGLMYFYAVQQWGDIPMPLSETESASREVVKSKASDVYVQIIKDLEEATTALKERVQTDYGRATKGAAEFLLARVYLTRGWNYTNINGESIGGSAADFDKAVEYADKVIAKYPLASDFYDLFPKKSENPLEETFPAQHDDNAEIVFAVQYVDDLIANASDATVNGRIGNDYHSIFGGGADDIPGSLGRTSHYNRHLEHFLHTPAMYRFFDPDIDKRFQLYWVDALYALSPVNNFEVGGTTIDISLGDTVVYFPPWNAPFDAENLGIDVGGTRPYAVINADEIGRSPGTPFRTQNRKIPLFWKFWQPGIEYDDALGTFDYALFRSSEAYLIAAEAILKGAGNGNLGTADDYYNKVVDRALGSNAGVDPMCAKFPENVTSLEAKSYRANGNINIDMILDERARELMGEYTRWYDLKRTGTLIERGKKYNPWMASSQCEIEEKHYLRPLPQSEIDRTQPTIENNPGY